MNAETLHAWTHHPAVFLLALAFALATPALGWLLATPLVGPRHRGGRAAWAVGVAAPAVLLAAAGLRAVAVVSGSGLAGAAWLDALGAPTGGWHPIDAAALQLPLLGAAMLVGAELSALAERSRSARDLSVPVAWPAAATCAGAALLGVAALWTTLQVRSTELAFVELALAAPIALIALAIGTRAADARPAQVGAAPEAEPEALERVDIVEAWRAIGAVRPEDRSFVKRDGEPVDAGGSAWTDAGGEGPPPGVIQALRQGLPPAGTAWQVGDLPEPAGRVVVAAAARVATREHGRSVLVIGSRSDTEGLRGLGGWSAGPVRVGLPELEAALADGELPAIAAIDADELSGGLRRLGDLGELWLRHLGLVVLARVDRGGPLATTHRVQALRRLHLRLGRAGASAGLLFTGFGGRPTQTLIQRAFPGTVVKEVPLAPASTRAVTVWLADWHFVARSPGAWVRKAAEPVARAGHPVNLADPRGATDAADLATWSDRVGLARDVTLEGHASVGLFDAAWLIAAWRALPNAVRTPDEPGRHHALWSPVDEPLTRFLLGERRIAKLLAADELPAPAPVVGTLNRPIARAHLAAALYDGEQDHEALVRVYGLPLVQELVGAPSGRSTLAFGPDGALVRGATLPRSSEDPGDPVRGTVTAQTLAVVDAESGRPLFAVDALTAPTRYYPRRVFAWEGRRYEVPLHALDARRERLEVASVAPDAPLTRPRLAVVARPKAQVRATESFVRGRFAWKAATFEVIAEESVSGASSGADRRVEYAPVTATWLTRARWLGFDGRPSRPVLAHLAAVASEVGRALMLVDPDDLAWLPVDAGWAEGAGPGLLVVERQVQGLGVAEALDEALGSRIFDWAHAVLAACDCPRGCARCTPSWAVEAGELDRPAVVALLRGG